MSTAAAAESILPTESPSEVLVDQGGRPLGPRALQTRQRILDTTVALLSEKKLRDLRVIDIARRIGSSPATFYQYFKDVEDVVLHLAKEASKKTPEMVDLIMGDWEGEAGLERGRKLAELVMNHWDRYGAILLVRNHASEQGDERFTAVRIQAMMPMVQAFGQKIAANRKRDDEAPAGATGSMAPLPAGSIDPTAGATVLASMLERLSAFHENVEEIGTSRERILETAATLLQFTLTSSR